VIDASALVELLLWTEGGERTARAIDGASFVAPDVVNPEVVQSLRGLERGGKLTGERAAKAVTRLAESDVACVPAKALLREMWSLRANLSAYDACYVALARALGAPLLTGDRRLSRAPGLGVTVVQV
jgi:predicted nucleic acid-binding protein